MGDKYELGSCFILQMLAESLYNGIPVNRIPELSEEEFSLLGESIDKNLETYGSSTDILERHSNVFGGSKGTGREVVNMTLIRLFHIKHAMGDNVYRARGVNTPPPRAGDFQFSVSYSGNTKIVVAWCEAVKKRKGYQLSVIGNENSDLGRKSDYKIILEETAEPGQPRRFYMRSAFLLSPLPVLLIERLHEDGLKLPEHVLNYYHSITE